MKMQENNNPLPGKLPSPPVLCFSLWLCWRFFPVRILEKEYIVGGMNLFVDVITTVFIFTYCVSFFLFVSAIITMPILVITESAN